jgi:hypothetical protein
MASKVYRPHGLLSDLSISVVNRAHGRRNRRARCVCKWQERAKELEASSHREASALRVR